MEVDYPVPSAAGDGGPLGLDKKEMSIWAFGLSLPLFALLFFLVWRRWRRKYDWDNPDFGLGRHGFFWR